MKYYNIIRSIFTSALLLTSSLILAQNGSLYLTNFQHESATKFQNWSVSQDKYQNMLFANRRGIMSYNGEEWQLIPTPGIPYILKYEESTEKVFVGCKDDFGYLSKDNKGFYHYNSLAEDFNTPGDFTRIEVVDSVIYFMSEQYFARIDPRNLKVKKEWSAEKEHPFTGIIHNQDHVFINVWNEGLHRLQSDTLFPIVSGFYTQKNEIIFSFPYNDERIILGTDENKLYLFDGMKFYNYSIKNSSYLEESIVSGGLYVSDSTFAISTLAGGAIIIDKNKDEITHTLNYETGLPDDEVFTLALDRNHGLWISHDNGISRADLALPVRNFSTFPGIEGNILNVIEKDTTIYVATGEGVFYLTEEKKYKKEEKRVQVIEKISAPVESEPEKKQEFQETKAEEPKEQDKKESKGFVRNFFNKLFKTGEKEEEKDKQKPEVKPKQETKTTQPKTKERVTYRTQNVFHLQSISHKYEKIQGLEGKCDQLKLFGDTILAGTNYGLYIIKPENQIQPILEGSYIYQILPIQKHRVVLFSTQNGIIKASLNNGDMTVNSFIDSIAEPVYSLEIDKKTNTLWAGTNNKTYQIKLDNNINANEIKTHTIQSNFSERYHTRLINDIPHVFTFNGIYKFNDSINTFIKEEKYLRDSSTFKEFEYIFNQKNISWLKYNNKWKMLNQISYWNDSLEGYLELFENIDNIYLSPNNFLYVIEQENLYRVDLKKDLPQNSGFKAFYSKIKKNGNEYFAIKDFNIDRENTSVEFSIAAPHFLKEGSTQYQYIIKGLMDDWSEWSTNHKIKLFTRKGSYTIKARARNIWGVVSETKEIKFEVPPPFTETIWFYGIVGFMAVILILFIIKLRERKLKRDKKILEQKVQERTKTIQEQNEEITHQRDKILETKNEVERKNKEITDSIEYASRIQRALLPMQEQFHKAFQDHFILYKPRDIVSGDFYWIHRQNGKTYVTAADCTGHGVPGAFMSMLGISYLNDIVSHDKETTFNAADVLNKLREMIKWSLNEEESRRKPKDGMDMALCIIDQENMVMDYAGAFNPLFFFRNGELHEYKADRMPVGPQLKEKGPFSNNRIEIKPGDRFYTFSDGYIDQFGGPHGKKLKMNTLRKLLKEIHRKDMEEQFQILDRKFEEWKGDYMQIDDVILLGVKI